MTPTGSIRSKESETISPAAAPGPTPEATGSASLETAEEAEATLAATIDYSSIETPRTKLKKKRRSRNRARQLSARTPSGTPLQQVKEDELVAPSPLAPIQIVYTPNRDEQAPNSEHVPAPCTPLVLPDGDPTMIIVDPQSPPEAVLRPAVNTPKHGEVGRKPMKTYSFAIKTPSQMYNLTPTPGPRPHDYSFGEISTDSELVGSAEGSVGDRSSEISTEYEDTDSSSNPGCHFSCFYCGCAFTHANCSPSSASHR